MASLSLSTASPFKPLVFEATLTPSPGVNAQYRTGARKGGGTYWRMTQDALDWMASTIGQIKREIDPLPEHMWWVCVTYHVHVYQQDTDACAKLLHDGIEAALGLETEQVQDHLDQRLKARERPKPHRWVNDEWYVQMGAKTFLPYKDRAKGKIELEVHAFPVKDKAEFSALSEEWVALTRQTLRSMAQARVNS